MAGGKSARALAQARVLRGERERARFGTIKSLAQGLLAECSRRLSELVESSELAECAEYPKLDLVFWGASGRPSMIELLVDYGGAGSASVAVWARPCALWRAEAPLREKARAWRRAQRLGHAEGWDDIWGEVLACAEILSAKERSIARGPDFSAWPAQRCAQEQDRRDWEAWLASAGPALEELRQEMNEIDSPEWEAGGLHAKALMRRLTQGSKKD